jgi:hypothetical protein
MAEPKYPNCACEGIEHFKSKKTLNGLKMAPMVYSSLL